MISNKEVFSKNIPPWISVSKSHHRNLNCERNGSQHFTLRKLSDQDPSKYKCPRPIGCETMLGGTTNEEHAAVSIILYLFFREDMAGI